MGLEKFAGENLMTRQVDALERIASALDYLVDSRKPSSYEGTIFPLSGVNEVARVDTFALPDESAPLDSPEKQSGLDGDVR